MFYLYHLKQCYPILHHDYEPEGYRQTVKSRICLIIATLILASLSGCIGDDDSDNSSSNSPCAGGTVDQDLIGTWTKYTDPDLTPNQIHIHANLEKTGSYQDVQISGYCWTAENSELIEHVNYPQWSVMHYIYSNYHIVGDLLFLGEVYEEWIDENGTSAGISYDDKPTECHVYHRLGAFSDNETINSTLLSIEYPDFCTWVFADPSGAHPGDAWNATYLAQDHSDSVSASVTDNLMTIEIDEFHGEIDWYVSEGYFGFWVELTVNNQTHQCDTGGESDCMITFSGVDVYYAVWEEGEIATLTENGVDICSVSCEIEITRFGVREEDTLAGNTEVTIQ